MGCFPGGSGRSLSIRLGTSNAPRCGAFIAGALLFALIILWALRKFSWNDYYAAKHQD